MQKIICPKCGEKIEKYKLGYRCVNPVCTFRIPREIRQKVLKEEVIRGLVTRGETDIIEGFHKRGSSGTFAAKLSLTGEYKIKLCLDEKTNLRCPKCGIMLQHFNRGFRCVNSEECGFVLWDRFCGKKLYIEQMKKIITEKRTDIIKGFISKKNGKLYSARIILDDEWKLKLEFEDTRPQIKRN